MKYRRLKGYKYDLVDAYVVDVPLAHALIHTPYIRIEEGVLTIAKHYAWDGPSGPTFDTKNFMRGSLIHDALYQLMREGQLGRDFRDTADRLLQSICIEDGMSKFRAWYVYLGVKWGAKKSSMPRANPRGQIITI